MRRVLAFAALVLTVAAPASLRAVPGGQIGTLPVGRYLCELPGDATNTAGQRVPDADFEVISASSYVVGHERGIYLLTGDETVMTSGPFRARHFKRTSYGVLKPLEADGGESAMRCVLAARRSF